MMSRAERSTPFGVPLAANEAHSSGGLTAMRAMEPSGLQRVAHANGDSLQRTASSCGGGDTMPHATSSSISCEARFADATSRLRDVLPRLANGSHAAAEPLLRYPRTRHLFRQQMTLHSDAEIAVIAGGFIASARRQVGSELEMARLQAMQREYAALTRMRAHHVVEQRQLLTRAYLHRASQQPIERLLQRQSAGHMQPGAEHHQQHYILPGSPAAPFLPQPAPRGLGGVPLGDAYAHWIQRYSVAAPALHPSVSVVGGGYMSFCNSMLREIDEQRGSGGPGAHLSSERRDRGGHTAADADIPIASPTVLAAHPALFPAPATSASPVGANPKKRAREALPDRLASSMAVRATELALKRANIPG